MSTPNPTLSSVAPRWATVSVVCAAVVFFVGERVSGGAFAVRMAAAVLLLPALYVGLRALRGEGGARRAGLTFTGVALVLGTGLLAYVYALPDGDAVRSTGQTALLFVGLFSSVLGAAGTVACELALTPMRQSDVVRMPRLVSALAAVFVAVSALFAVAGFNYAAHKSKIRRDFAVNAPTSPSESVRSLVLAAKEPVEVFLFFERGSEALIEIKDYFDALAADGVKVTELDHALDAELAKTLKVKKNGTVAVRHGEKSKTWFIGEERADARRKLEKLDKEIRTRLSQVTRDKVTVYSTTGHGERGTKKAKKGARDGVSILKQLMKTMNVVIKDVGVGDGLAQAVPEDADVVLIMGPTADFLTAEVDALLAYLQRGGSVYVLLEPGSDAGLARLLDTLGVEVSTSALANEKTFIPMTRGPSDVENLFSVNFPRHPAVQTFGQARGEAGLIFRRAAHVGKRKVDKDHRLTAIARAHRDTFLDENGNRRFDAETEKRKVYDFAVAIERPADDDETSRGIVIGDSDVFSDFLMDKQTHQVFAVESIFWLLRDDLAGGAMPETNDTPIDHTADEDKFWFYLTTLGAPLMVLLFGLLWVRWRTRGRRR